MNNNSKLESNDIIEEINKDDGETLGKFLGRIKRYINEKKDLAHKDALLEFINTKHNDALNESEYDDDGEKKKHWQFSIFANATNFKDEIKDKIIELNSAVGGKKKRSRRSKKRTRKSRKRKSTKKKKIRRRRNSTKKKRRRRRRKSRK